jgi:hypothetical protein
LFRTSQKASFPSVIDKLIHRIPVIPRLKIIDWFVSPISTAPSFFCRVPSYSIYFPIYFLFVCDMAIEDLRHYAVVRVSTE